MDIREAAMLLSTTKERIEAIIRDGLELPRTNERVRLTVTQSPAGRDVSDADLDAFILRFEQAEPGRHPPVAVRRTLLVESAHRCAICEDAAPLQFHHLLEWAKLPHHDHRHMLAICGTCHSLCGNGTIDRVSQQLYKERLAGNGRSSLGGAATWTDGISWDDLAIVIQAIHETIPPSSAPSSSKYDFNEIDLVEKNSLNNLGQSYFNTMREHDEPYFHDIQQFLQNPHNVQVTESYFEIVDEIRRRIALIQDRRGPFEAALLEITKTAKATRPDALKTRCVTLNRLLSFMYFTCDIGKKK